MRNISRIAFGLCLWMALGASASAVEDALKRKLLANNIQVGMTGDSIVEIGVYIDESVGEQMENRDFITTRQCAFDFACLEARRKILQRVHSVLGGGRRSKFQMEEDDGSSSTDWVSEIFSRRVLSGWRVISKEERLQNGRFSVAVAVQWSPDQEKEYLIAQKGGKRCSPSWKSELVMYLKNVDLLDSLGAISYVDSLKCSHLVAIGAAAAEDSELFDEVSFRLAQTRAKANLIRYVFGDQLVHEAARKRRDELYSRNVRGDLDAIVDQAFEYGILNKVQYVGPEPAGIEEICVKKLRSSVNGKYYFVAAYAYQAPGKGGNDGTGELGDVDLSLRFDRYRELDHETAASTGMRVFNPATGRFDSAENSTDAKEATKREEK